MKNIGRTYTNGFSSWMSPYSPGFGIEAVWEGAAADHLAFTLSIGWAQLINGEAVYGSDLHKEYFKDLSISVGLKYIVFINEIVNPYVGIGCGAHLYNFPINLEQNLLDSGFVARGSSWWSDQTAASGLTPSVGAIIPIGSDVSLDVCARRDILFTKNDSYSAYLGINLGARYTWDEVPPSIAPSRHAAPSARHGVPLRHHGVLQLLRHHHCIPPV